MEAIFLDCGAGGPQLKRSPLDGTLMSQLPAWLQALAALGSLGFAYALYRITREYVTATKEIALSTAAQVEILRASGSLDAKRKEALVELQQHLTAIRDFLNSVPDPTNRQDAARRTKSAIPLADSTFDGVLSAARRIGAASAQKATSLVQATRWMSTRVREVQSVSPTLGFDWQHFDWDGWGSRYLEASLALNALVDERAV